MRSMKAGVLGLLWLSTAPCWGVEVREVAYVTNFRDDTVSVIDVASLAVTHTIRVGDGPMGIAAAPDGTAVYVANFRSGTVSVLDTRTQAVRATIDIGGAANSLAVSPDGRSVYVTNTAANTVEIIDTARAAVVTTIPVDPEPAGIALAPTRQLAFVASFQRAVVDFIDTAAELALGALPLGDGFLLEGPIGVAVAPNERLVCVTSYFSNQVRFIDLDLGFVRGVLQLEGAGPEAAVFSPDSASAYVVHSGSDQVVRIDTSVPDRIFFEVVQTLPVGAGPEAIAVTSDGAFLYVANSGGATVTVVNARRWRQHATIRVGRAPMGVAITKVPVPPCPGDCDGNRQVELHELVLGVHLALSEGPLDACTVFDQDESGSIDVAELVAATDNALHGCDPGPR